MEETPKQLVESISQIFKAGLCPMISGSPGIGKSDIIRQVAKNFNLKVIDFRLSQCDQTDILGFPTKINERMTYAPPMHFPLELDRIPTGYDGWLLFLDEFNSINKSVEAAAYKLILDRSVGVHNLHKNVVIAGAGNKITDKAIVNAMGTAMQTRMVHLQLAVSVVDWLEWANSNSLDYRITSFIDHRPDLLHKFDPDHNDQTFACPRTWEFSHKIISCNNSVAIKDLLPVLAGTLSEGVAREFIVHTDTCTKLPTIKDIKQAPTSINIDTEPSLLYAVSHMVGAYLTEDNADKLMQYVERLPLEFGTICIRSAIKRQKDILKVNAVRDWTHHLATEIF